MTHATVGGASRALGGRGRAGASAPQRVTLCHEAATAAAAPSPPHGALCRVWDPKSTPIPPRQAFSGGGAQGWARWARGRSVVVVGRRPLQPAGKASPPRVRRAQCGGRAASCYVLTAPYRTGDASSVSRTALLSGCCRGFFCCCCCRALPRAVPPLCGTIGLAARRNMSRCG